VLPEQGQSLAKPVCGRAPSLWHGIATGSARTWCLGSHSLLASRGRAPALVATVVRTAQPACLAVATTCPRLS
jgi:hypothetical protein